MSPLAPPSGALSLLSEHALQPGSGLLTILAVAVHPQVGVRMDVLPMSPGAVLEALWAKEGQQAAD